VSGVFALSRGEKQSMKALFTALLLILITAPCFSQTVEPIPIKIESTEWDRPKFLEKLNESGESHKLRFQLADEDFAYRIVFSIGQSTGTYNGSTSGFNSATADVYDAQGNEVFRVFRNNRLSEGGVTNAVAKEVAKRLAKIREESSKSAGRDTKKR
jgi:hypothetical protein